MYLQSGKRTSQTDWKSIALWLIPPHHSEPTGSAWPRQTHFNRSENYFRLALAESLPPCIPYIGLILQDLTFVQIGNQDFLDEKINFAKRWQQFNILVDCFFTTAREDIMFYFRTICKGSKRSNTTSTGTRIWSCSSGTSRSTWRRTRCGIWARRSNQEDLGVRLTNDEGTNLVRRKPLSAKTCCFRFKVS